MLRMAKKGPPIDALRPLIVARHQGSSSGYSTYFSASTTGPAAGPVTPRPFPRSRVIRVEHAHRRAAGGGRPALLQRCIAAGDEVGALAIDLHTYRPGRIVGLGPCRSGDEHRERDGQPGQYAHSSLLAV